MRENPEWIGVIIAIVIAIASATFSVGMMKGKFDAMNNDVHELRQLVDGLRNIVQLLDKQSGQYEVRLANIERTLEKLDEKLDSIISRNR